MQGELAASAVWGVVEQPVYIKFRQQIIAPKIRSLAALVQREVIFRKKNRRDWPWYDKLICYRTLLSNLQPNIVYKQNVFQSLSQLRWQLSLPKRAMLFVRFEMLICNRTSVTKRACLAICHRCLFIAEDSSNNLKRGDQWSPLRAIWDLLWSVAE